MHVQHGAPSEADGSASMQSVRFKPDLRKSRRSQTKPIFADAAAMKAKLKARMLEEEEYDVTSFYHAEGWAQKVARHPFFERLTLGFIAFNAVWIGIDAEYNNASMLITADLGWVVMENVFCIYFSGELLIRFLSFKQKRSCLQDSWFLFDSALVALMIFETWLLTLVLQVAGAGAGAGSINMDIMRMGRLMRLTRMARMARLLRMMPELLVLIKGLAAAMRSVLFTLLLLLLMTYMFAIAFKSLTEGMRCSGQYFASMGMSIHSLIIYGTFLDDIGTFTKDLLQDVSQHRAFHLLPMFYVYVLLSSLTVLNMLVGVLVQVVTAVSATETEAMTIALVKEKLQHIMECTAVDFDNNGLVSEDEFTAMLDNPEATRCLKEVGVDVIGLVDIADDIFESKEELNFGEFADVLLNLRGSNNATVRDIVDLRKSIRGLVSSNMHHLREELLSLKGDSPLGSAGPRRNWLSHPQSQPTSLLIPGDAALQDSSIKLSFTAVQAAFDGGVAASRNSMASHHYAAQQSVEQSLEAARSSFNEFIKTSLVDDVDVNSPNPRSRVLKKRRDKIETQFASLTRSFRDVVRGITTGSDDSSTIRSFRDRRASEPAPTDGTTLSPVANFSGALLGRVDFTQEKVQHAEPLSLENA